MPSKSLVEPGASILGAMQRNLLIVYHSQSGRTESMAHAVRDGASDPLIERIELRLLRAASAGPDDLLWAHALLLGTPENFGYMSGAMKDFFDRTFYPVEGRIQSLPYAMFISAGNDGTGAIRAIRRIANGYPLREVQEPVIARGDVTTAVLDRCRELGMTLAAGLEAGIY
jgi:flavorubredoxin